MKSIYPHGIKNANKLPVQDLRAIAYFNRIIKNYLKMCRMLEETKPETE